MGVDAEFLVTLERHRLRQRISPLLGEMEAWLETHGTDARLRRLLNEIRWLLA